MADKGRIEALITVPTGGYTFTITETGGGGASDTVTIPAGTYYHSTADSTANDFLAELQAQTDAATLNASYTWSFSHGESGTGKYRVVATGGSVTAVTFAWTSTIIRDLIGFDGTETADLDQTGTDNAQAVWFPSTPPQVLNGASSAGWWEAEMPVKENAHGNVFAVLGRDKRINNIIWPAEPQNKVWTANESSGNVNESFETFLREGIHGTASWGSAAGPIRWYPDGDVDGSSFEYGVVGLATWKPEQLRQNWVGRWLIDFGRLVQVP